MHYILVPYLPVLSIWYTHGTHLIYVKIDNLHTCFHNRRSKVSTAVPGTLSRYTGYLPRPWFTAPVSTYRTVVSVDEPTVIKILRRQLQRVSM
jgi:hypothetical protein